jgi:hypothetical protein
VSYWNKTGNPFSVTGSTGVIRGTTVNGWTYFEHTVQGTSSIAVTGTGNIDELRLYPSGAQMVTYTYSPLIGMTSRCDVNNRITFYEYDGFLRLHVVRDQDWNVVKTFNYNYVGKNQAAAAAPPAQPLITVSNVTAWPVAFTFYNTATGVIYPMPAGTGNSTLSLPAGTYNVTMGGVDAGGNYRLIYTYGSLPPQSYSSGSIVYNNQVINGNVQITLSQPPSVALTITNTSNQEITFSFQDAQSNLGYNYILPAGLSTSGTIPAGIYNCTFTPDNVVAGYVIAYSLNGTAASGSGAVTIANYTISGPSTMTASP